MYIMESRGTKVISLRYHRLNIKDIWFSFIDFYVLLTIYYYIINKRNAMSLIPVLT